MIFLLAEPFPEDFQEAVFDKHMESAFVLIKTTESKLRAPRWDLAEI